jgi:hypothetical protein
MRVLNRIIKFLLILILTVVSASAQDVEDDFLTCFKEINQFPSGDYFLENKVLKINDTIPLNTVADKFLLPVNSVRYSNIFRVNKYFYYGKFKLNSRCYLISCKVFYDYHESKIFTFTYDSIDKRVTSCLEIMSTDLYLSRRSFYTNNELTIESTYKRILNGLDPPIEKEFLRKTIIEKYRVDENNKFVSVK